MQIAYFAGGCFWCVEAIFQRVNGVEKVVSGYCNGRGENPSYAEVCTGESGFAEVVEIHFDEARVEFAELLKVFFVTHDPTTYHRQGNDVGSQYRSAVFWVDESQRDLAQRAISELGANIVTEVTPLDIFYPAEGYHQNYYNQNQGQNYCQLVISPKIDKYFGS